METTGSLVIGAQCANYCNRRASRNSPQLMSGGALQNWECFPIFQVRSTCLLIDGASRLGRVEVNHQQQLMPGLTIVRSQSHRWRRISPDPRRPGAEKVRMAQSMRICRSIKRRSRRRSPAYHAAGERHRHDRSTEPRSTAGAKRGMNLKHCYLTWGVFCKYLDRDY